MNSPFLRKYQNSEKAIEEEKLRDFPKMNFGSFFFIFLLFYSSLLDF
jgi:hypothetical protein